MSVWTIVVAAGSGSRFGGEVPKQYAPLGDRRVLDWSLAGARSASDGVVLVVAPDRANDAEPLADAVVAGGATRSASVRAGLDAVRTRDQGVEVVVVHDAARPLASRALYDAVIAAVRAGADAALPGLPVVDTIKRVAGDLVTATVDRTDLVAVQTPQAFRAGALDDAHAGGGEATDDAALVEAAGGKVVVVPGEEANRKITVASDLVIARSHLDASPLDGG
jgi:2-C-methyl-D-erythritol 4-phosphate cytidylyltransferase